MRASSTLKISLVSLVAISACGSSDASGDTVALKPKITISSTTDPVSELIAEIYGQSLEKAEFRVARKKPFESSGELLAAMSTGDVQLTGITSRSLLALLGNAPAPDDLNTITLQTAEIAKTLPATVKAGTPTTAEDVAAVYCATTFTDANAIVSLTDLGAKPGIATLAAPDGFDTATPLGGATLTDTYEIEFKSVVPTEADKTLDAVTSGTADCGVGSSGDPALSDAAVTVLQDDKTLVPNDVILPLINTEAGTDDVIATLDAISGRLTPQSLRALMAQMSVDGASPEVVANTFVGNAGS